MAGDVEYTVQSNDCLSKIAKEYGFTWKKLWDYGPNAGLKAKRKDPNILLPGDVVRIPSPEKKEESKKVDGTHKFVRKMEQSDLHLRLLLDGEPIEHTQCVLTVHGVSSMYEKEGKTDGDGNVEIDGSKDIKLPSDTVSAKLQVGKPDSYLEFDLLIGELVPHDQLLGVQQRLNNLGFEAGDIVSPFKFSAAVRRFGQIHDLTEPSAFDKTTQKKIAQVHGC